MSAVSVLVADPQRLFREALAQALAAEYSVTVCAMLPSSAAALLVAVETSEPDVVLADSVIVDDALLQTIRTRAPAVKVIVLSWLDQTDHVEAVLAAGAVGWLVKTGGVDSLVTAIRQADAGKSPVCSDRLEQLLIDVRQRRASAERTARRLARLTTREREVVEWLAVGATTTEIAQQLGITARTVQTHIRNLKGKTGARTQLEIAHMVNRQVGTPRP